MAAVRLLLAALALASPGQAVDWSKEVVGHFVEPHTREHVNGLAKDKNKPIMVIAMTTWCGACSGLRKSVNDGKLVNPLLDKFVVAYATEEGEANVWTVPGENYVPQVYFFNPSGEQLHIHAEGNFKYFFSDEARLEGAMKEALKLVGEGTVGQAKGASAPVPGLEEEKIKIEASPHPEHKEVIFDPSHAFDKSISGHFLENIKPEDLHKKAIEANRPFMVVLTQEWCKACQDLVTSVNGGTHAKDLLSAFVVSHAYGEEGLENWQPREANYVPQALFFDVDGTLMDVKSKYDKFQHFFSSDEELGAAMATALDMSKSAGEL